MTNTETNHPKVWEQLPNETAKAYSAFSLYRDLPPYGERARSIARVAQELGYADAQVPQKWSMKFNWVERSRAFDAYQQARSLSIREVAHEAFAKTVIEGTTMRVTAIHTLVDNQLRRLMKRQEDNPEEILDIKDLNQLARLVKVLDEVQRRAAGLPTTYTSEKGKDVPEDDKVYIIGNHAES